MNTSQSISPMNDQHRATPEQWQAIKANGHLPTRSTIRELLCRIEALEAAQQAHADASHVIDPEREKAAREFMQAAGFAPRWPAVAFAPRWSEFERCAASIEAPKEAKPVDSPPQPNHPEISSGSLVDRVAAVIDNGTACDREPKRIARAAIREVAAWLGEQKGYDSAWAIRLEQEAER